MKPKCFFFNDFNPSKNDLVRNYKFIALITNKITLNNILSVMPRLISLGIYRPNEVVSRDIPLGIQSFRILKYGVNLTLMVRFKKKVAR